MRSIEIEYTSKVERDGVVFIETDVLVTVEYAPKNPNDNEPVEFMVPPPKRHFIGDPITVIQRGDPLFDILKDGLGPRFEIEVADAIHGRDAA